LPPGLVLDSTSGAVTGTLTNVGTFVFTISATDTVGGAASKSYTIVIT
jgi:hypothetical protein